MKKIDSHFGYHITTKEWLIQFDSWKDYYRPYPSQKTKVSQVPKGLDPIKWMFQPMPPGEFMAVIPWGRVWGVNGSVITPNNKLLWDVSFEYNKSPKKHPFVTQKKQPPTVYTPETLAVLTAQCSFNYFHWMFDVLTKLRMLETSTEKIDRFVINRGKYYSPEACRYQDESLRLLGIPKEKVIECTEETNIQASKLIVSSMAGYTAYVPKDACDYIRNTFLHKLALNPVKKRKKIFITREDAVHRRLLNESEVYKELKNYGFEFVNLYHLSFEEKIKVFHSAEIVVSSHGAGLTNIIFCEPGTKVIELFTPTYKIPCFHTISSYMNLDYYYIIGEKVEEKKNRSTHSDPILINVEKLKKTLELANISRK